MGKALCGSVRGEKGESRRGEERRRRDLQYCRSGGEIQELTTLKEGAGQWTTWRIEEKQENEKRSEKKRR